jgi:hypothetical protein
MRTVHWTVLGAAALGFTLAGGPGGPGAAGAQPVFDHLKCYGVRDSVFGEYTADLHPKDTANFAVEPGDVIVGGVIRPGCRIRLPAKYFCTDVDKRNARQSRPPYDPAQWTVMGPEAGDRLCYKLRCPPVPAKQLDVVDQFGTRRISVTGKPVFLCTPVSRPAAPGNPCDVGGDGQCGGTCPPGDQCLAISGEECGCVPAAEACAQVTTCQSGRCPGLWETCAIQTLGICGCNHP